jgi:hypothetical protein
MFAFGTEATGMSQDSGTQVSARPPARRQWWSTAFTWGRGCAAAIALIGVLSTIGGDAVQTVLSFSDALTRKWNGVILDAVSWLTPYLPFIDRIDRHDINSAAVFFTLTLPIMISSYGPVRQIEKEILAMGSIPTRRLFGLRASTGIAVVAIGVTVLFLASLLVTGRETTEARGTLNLISLLVQACIAGWFLWRSREDVKTYVTSLTLALTFILTLDALYYAPMIGEWIKAATDWLNAT